MFFSYLCPLNEAGIPTALFQVALLAGPASTDMQGRGNKAPPVPGEAASETASRSCSGHCFPLASQVVRALQSGKQSMAAYLITILASATITTITNRMTAFISARCASFWSSSSCQAAHREFEAKKREARAMAIYVSERCENFAIASPYGPLIIVLLYFPHLTKANICARACRLQHCASWKRRKRTSPKGPHMDFQKFFCSQLLRFEGLQATLEFDIFVKGLWELVINSTFNYL